MSQSRVAASWGQSLVLLVGMTLAWHLLVSSGVWDSTIVPSPVGTARAIWEFRVVLARDTAVTFGEILLGFALTVVASLVAAVIIHTTPRLSRGVYGLLVILQCVPLWAIAPVLFYWTGPGLVTRLVVIVLVAFFPVLVNTLEGLQRIDRDLMDLFDSLGATTGQKLLRLEIPSALYMVLAGFKVTLTLCLIGAVLAEMVIGDLIGLGYRIKQANAHFRVDLVFGCLVLLGVLASILLSGLSLLSQRLQPWLSSQEGE